jgi:hypothetical protein
MSEPLVVTVSHRLGQEEAVRRIKKGFDRTHATLGHHLAQVEQRWSGATCEFRARILGQSVNGTIAVAADHVRIEVLLPWLLAQIAGRVQGLIRRESQLMLEKK